MNVFAGRGPLVFTVATLAALWATAMPVSADTSPLTVEITLVHSSNLTMGEPVILHYKISNASNEEVDVSMGPDRKGWLNRQLVDATGLNVPLVSDATLSQQKGITSNGARVEANKDYQGYVVVGRSFVFLHPGKYTLSIHARLPYGTGQEALATGFDRLESAFGTVFSQDFTFTLNVTPADPTQLQTAAETYRQEIAQDKTGNMTAALVEALFSLPEAEALPTWKELASDPNLSALARSHIIAQLLHVHSQATADIMADMVWNPAQTVDTVPAFRDNFLAEMYVAGDTALKQHIKAIYAAHGTVMPDSPNIDTVND